MIKNLTIEYNINLYDNSLARVTINDTYFNIVKFDSKLVNDSYKEAITICGAIFSINRENHEIDRQLYCYLKSTKNPKEILELLNEHIEPYYGYYFYNRYIWLRQKLYR